MIHIMGYIGLVLNLLSMAMKDVIHLRLLSLIANAIYVFYGILLHAPPLIIGCSIAVMIHGYHIYKLIQENKVME